MNFDESKKLTLKKMLSNDKSNKGSVDNHISHLVDVINDSENFYTTSSCSGRIILIRIPLSGLKRDAEFLFRSHEKTNSDKVVSIINELLNYSGSVWFRQEPAIIHVASRTMDDAYKLLIEARKIGFKRAGLFEFKKRIVMELLSTENINSIISKDGKVLVSDEYIKVLIDDANKKLEKTWLKIEKLTKKITTFK